MPAQCVPWLKELLGGFGLLSLSETSKPFTSSINPFPSSSTPLLGISPALIQRLPTKSWCARSTALSITAIFIFDPTENEFQALAAFIVAKCHCEPKEGSLGIKQVLSIGTLSAYTTFPLAFN